MNGMILAAGLGTRLRPWTLEHPKALVPVDGVPMLERVMKLMASQGYDNIIVNVHHFADQVLEFLEGNDFGISVRVSDESDLLLDTGGGILQASKMMADAPLLVHNVDILSSADLGLLHDIHIHEDNDITLLVCDRDSSRKLVFDSNRDLCGWHNLKTDEYRKVKDFQSNEIVELAFSGIYILGKNALLSLDKYSSRIAKKSFPIMDFLLSGLDNLKIRALRDDTLKILDIGKPSSLEQAEKFLETLQVNSTKRRVNLS